MDEETQVEESIRAEERNSGRGGHSGGRRNRLWPISGTGLNSLAT